MSDHTPYFAGYDSEEYKLMKQAIPHMDEMHARMGKIVAAYEPRLSSDPITVLEIGCGDGLFTHTLFCVRNDIQLTAIDIDSEAAALAKENLQPWSQLRDYTIVHADIIEYIQTQAPNSLDLIVSIECLHNLLDSDRVRVLAKAFEILKPGGCFVNGDKYAQWGEVHQQALAWELESYFDVCLPIAKHDFLKKWVLHTVSDEAPEKIMRETDAIAKMRNLGFVDTKIVYRRKLDAILVAYKPEDV